MAKVNVDLQTTKKAVEDYFNGDFHEALECQDALELWTMIPCDQSNDLYQFGQDIVNLAGQGQLRVEGDPELLQDLIVYRPASCQLKVQESDEV